MSSLGPGDANALVQLRAMLEQARQSAGASSPVGRLTALVLLDAVNERITHLAAQTLPGVQVGPKDKFEDMYSKVKAELQSTWTQNSWVEVRQLHRARNAAQHEGIGADPALLPGFAIATEKYTSSLVQAVFAVRIDQVYLADAVADPTIADRLRAAERALATTDVTAAMQAIKQAFKDAFDTWLLQHQSAHRRRLSNGFSEFREIEHAMDWARDLVVAQSFATDPAEYTWFSHIRQSDPATVTSDEARRALTFVFWWIVRWESISSSMVPDDVRRNRWLKHQRQNKVRSDERSARLEGVTMRPFHSDRYVATIGITDLPSEDTYNEWRMAVRDEVERIRTEDKRFATLDDDDSISVEIRANEDPTMLVHTLSDALRRAETAAGKMVEQNTQERDKAEQEARAFAAEFAESADQVPGWVSDVYLSDIRETSHGHRPSRLRVRPSEHVGGHWAKVREALVAHPAISAVIGTVDGTLRIDPELDVPDILRVLQDVDPAISPQLDDERRRLDVEARAKTDLLNKLTSALRQLP